MASLELRNVQKSYGNSQIATLKDIALKIDAGEFLILVGPSGCGKSTLMNCIAGLENITGGEILVDGEDISQASPKDRDIAMVFQSYALYPTMSVRDNIAFGLKMRKVPAAKIEEEVARVAKLLQIEPLLERKPSQLSGGQQQRVAMGRALARRPKIYLFDEPLSNLDAKLRVEMRTEMKLMHQRLKTTTVYVTHDQIEAMTLGDKVAVLMVDARGDRIHHFELSLTTLGSLINAAGGTVTGTALDDRIIGSAAAETLQGGAGNDWLHDGGGLDLLRGGAGRDVFVFDRDGQADRVADFERGTDRLDLSDWGRIYSASALSIVSTPTGAEIRYGTELLYLDSVNAQSLSAGGFSDADFIF